jgi:methylenetetrahydrofolate reductase (NADPH)
LAKPFHERILSGGFEILVRIAAPRSHDLASIVSSLSSWKGLAGSVLVSDNQCARMGICPLVLAERLNRDGHDVIMTMSCRDRNRIALGSFALGCAALSLNSILCVSGDHFRFGDHPEAKPVYDLDSVQLIAMLRKMEKGADIGDNQLEGSFSCCLGAAVAVAADPLEPQLNKAKKKISAGADFFVTLPIFTIDQLDPFLSGLKNASIKIIAGVLLPSYAEIARYQDGSLPGTFIPESVVRSWRDAGEIGFPSSSVEHVRKLISDLRQSGKVSGVCISASGRESEIGAVL